MAWPFFPSSSSPLYLLHLVFFHFLLLQSLIYFILVSKVRHRDLTLVLSQWLCLGSYPTLVEKSINSPWKGFFFFIILDISFISLGHWNLNSMRVVILSFYFSVFAEHRIVFDTQQTFSKFLWDNKWMNEFFRIFCTVLFYSYFHTIRILF